MNITFPELLNEAQKAFQGRLETLKQARESVNMSIRFLKQNKATAEEISQKEAELYSIAMSIIHTDFLTNFATSSLIAASKS